MSFFQKLKETKPRVKYLLEKYPHLRDDDYKLISYFFYLEVPNIKELSAVEFLEKLSKGELSHTETIRRNRASLQKEFEHLQGNVYKERHEEGEDVRKNIHDL